MHTTTGIVAQSCGGWGMHGWDGGWMWLWGSLMMLTWVAVIGGAVWLIARATRSDGRSPGSNARSILDERLARGEITPEEHQQRRKLVD
jgi:putative membrane protein